MIYLDNGATSFHKPPAVRAAVISALERCANPGRGGYKAAMEAAEVVYGCREAAGELFSCQPEQVVLTMNCTHGLNIAIRTLVRPGARVLITGFEHNAVTRPLHALGAKLTMAGHRLFDWENTLEEWKRGLDRGQDAAIFTHVSNVFGYILPVEEMAAFCRQYDVPFIVDAAQSAGMLPVDFGGLGADFVAMPGHKGLLGPQGTGLLLCNRLPDTLLCGGTGSNSREQTMPEFLPDRAEAGTMNVPGIAGLTAGINYVNKIGVKNILLREQLQARRCVAGLQDLGLQVFAGNHQGGTLSFLAGMDCEKAAKILENQGIAVRAGLHCAPLAHATVGTVETGTVRVSFGHDAAAYQTNALLQAAQRLR